MTLIKDEIDLIITKAVSWFARNTVDSLSTIRKLKEHNIECYFGKDEIIANTEMIQKMLCDNSELEAKRDALQEEIAVTVVFKDGTEMKAE